MWPCLRKHLRERRRRSPPGRLRKAWSCIALLKRLLYRPRAVAQINADHARSRAGRADTTVYTCWSPHRMTLHGTNSAVAQRLRSDGSLPVPQGPDNDICAMTKRQGGHISHLARHLKQLWTDQGGAYRDDRLKAQAKNLSQLDPHGMRQGPVLMMECTASPSSIARTSSPIQVAPIFLGSRPRMMRL
jgi:hypothetical protein